MKSSTPRPEAISRAARGRQHVVGARDVVADHLRRVRPKEDRAGIANPSPRCASGSSVAISRCSAAMRSASAGASSSDPHQDDRAERTPAFPRDIAARQYRELAGDSRLDGLGEIRIVGHQDRLRCGVVLSLRQQVGRDPFRLVVPCRR